MAVNLKNIRFAYPEHPEKIVLDISEWSAARGEHVFVHGPSGCGKSTLLNLISGMLNTPKGEVSVLGERLNQMSNRQRDQFRANHIGYIFQQFNLIPYLNPIDNVQLARQFSKNNNSSSTNEIQSLLNTFNIPQSEWHKPVSKLSIGQQQRIAIARAMINKPELLIADEPTSSLDQDNRDNFMSELMTLASESHTTLLFVSHDMSLAKYFKRIDELPEINAAGVHA